MSGGWNNVAYARKTSDCRRHHVQDTGMRFNLIELHDTPDLVREGIVNKDTVFMVISHLRRLFDTMSPPLRASISSFLRHLRMF